LDPIVIGLQKDCLKADAPISILLRKAKLIASKLKLEESQEWIESELNGFRCPLGDLPQYRIGIGQPKFHNPVHGWLDIVITNSSTKEMVSTAYFAQPIAEIESLAGGEGQFIIIGFLPPINDFLHDNLQIQFNCGLHVSKTVLIGALEGVRNLILDWAIDLESQGIVGEGVTFSTDELEKAQSVVTNIYDSNVGVLGNVGKNAKVSDFSVRKDLNNFEEILSLVKKIREASLGLPSDIRPKLDIEIERLEGAAKQQDQGKVKKAVNAMIVLLQNTGGSLAATGILAALGVT
tara:strand:- start:5156 stop:6031 length:876 start_codon:yes stop_codon:yes gene_type:complete